MSKKTFQIGIPNAKSKLKVTFRQPTHEEFDIENYGYMAQRFNQYQRDLSENVAATFEDDMKIQMKSNAAVTAMSDAVVAAMQATQVKNNNGGADIDMEKKLMGDDGDTDILAAFVDGGAIEEWLIKVLPIEGESGN